MFVCLFVCLSMWGFFVPLKNVSLFTIAGEGLQMFAFHLTGKIGVNSLASVAVNGKRVADWPVGNVNKRYRVYPRRCHRDDVNRKRPYTLHLWPLNSEGFFATPTVAMANPLL